MTGRGRPQHEGYYWMKMPNGVIDMYYMRDDGWCFSMDGVVDDLPPASSLWDDIQWEAIPFPKSLANKVSRPEPSESPQQRSFDARLTRSLCEIGLQYMSKDFGFDDQGTYMIIAAETETGAIETQQVHENPQGVSSDETLWGDGMVARIREAFTSETRIDPYDTGWWVKDPHQMVGWALVPPRPVEEDPDTVFVREGSLICPTLERAQRLKAIRPGDDSWIIRVDLPHPWYYDTKPYGGPSEWFFVTNLALRGSPVEDSR
jgi:hypothetical protein